MCQKITRLWFVFVILLASNLAQAASYSYEAILAGSFENPSNLSPGTGTGTFVYDSLAHTLAMDIDFSGLTGSTTAAHLHCCIDAPNNVGVATSTPSFPGFPLGVTAGSYFKIFDLTDSVSWNSVFVAGNGGTFAGAEAALFAGLEAGQVYLNIHTSAFGAGEIRGFLEPEAAGGVPEPTTLALLGGGILGFGRYRFANNRR